MSVEMDRILHGLVTLEWKPPMSGEYKRIELRIERDVCEEYLRPLPRGRELPFLPEERAEAAGLLARREKFVEQLGRDIAARLLKLLRADDTVNGYPRGTR